MAASAFYDFTFLKFKSYQRGLQIRKLATSVLNKQPRTTDKGCSYNVAVGWRANGSSP